ncbi:hypothetical protein ANI02nite_29410 [Acetobacter nitrogenifigens DSM 23921 = NBRC 105050]|uniref:Uncharacterized protein n=1 Tax=Acetobacter nitrogenifigens DSM 23921 = NBRC 105050 TaxID=1120919 RepID=A0A511XDN7_9PROT|nr:hypothetical protein ANI02nite_29410 [Acetobacter nitrogenifigens DSM 23921 = NBRC 105050]
MHAAITPPTNKAELLRSPEAIKATIADNGWRKKETANQRPIVVNHTGKKG